MGFDFTAKEPLSLGAEGVGCEGPSLQARF